MIAVKEFFQIPKFCPVCGGNTSEDGAFLFCRSRACPAQLSGSIRVWVKRLGLLHWGDTLIDTLTDPTNPKINSIADLYRLTVEDISECCSGVKVAQKCHSVLHSNKNIPFELFLASLNIQNLALSTASDIVHAGYNSVDKILAITFDQLISIQNIGDITANHIINGIKEKTPVIVDLASVLDLKLKSGVLVGCVFCITGATSKPRKSIEKIIMDSGGSVKSSVGSGVTHLITNDADTGSKKLQSAMKHGTKIISEAEFYSMM